MTKDNAMKMTYEAAIRALNEAAYQARRFAMMDGVSPETNAVLSKICIETDKMVDAL